MLPRATAILTGLLALLITMPAGAAGVPPGIVAESRVLEKQQQPEVRQVPTQLVEDVSTVLEGVPLFQQAKATQAAPAPTVHIRPAFNFKGPVALLDVRF